jgi:hypothetical protein
MRRDSGEPYPTAKFISQQVYYTRSIEVQPLMFERQARSLIIQRRCFELHLESLDMAGDRFSFSPDTLSIPYDDLKSSVDLLRQRLSNQQRDDRLKAIVSLLRLCCTLN